MQSYDLVVIGSGPAGEKAAAQAAYFGKRVALVESGIDPGGACVNSGTIPSKILRESALYFSGLKQRGLYGIDYSLREGLTVEGFTHRKNVIVELEREEIRKNLAAHHVDVFWGTGSFEDQHTIAVASPKNPPMQLRGEVILIATGSRPHRPPEIPFDDKFIFDSDSILQMDRLPQSMVVIGGGVIGCEYASIFTALGVKVSLVDGRDRLLPFLDAELSNLLRERLAALGVEFFLEERVAKTERTPNGARLTLKSGKVLEADAALFAAGRRGTVEGLGLEKINLALNQRGYIDVNESYQTSIPWVYAAGDVIGFPALASTSMEQGRVAICHAFGFGYKKRLASQLPMGVYTIPEISAVGETEESCREHQIDYVAGRARYANNVRGAMVGDMSGLLKLLFRRDDRKLLGVHIIGESATELIHAGMVVLEIGGTIDLFIAFVFNFPTLSEMYKYAAYDGLGNLAKHKLREG
ncbi:MAG: Si-specific NAD(P)(+) transhydrogenase [Candidatus Acidiferrales bacterium]